MVHGVGFAMHWCFVVNWGIVVVAMSVLTAVIKVRVVIVNLSMECCMGGLNGSVKEDESISKVMTSIKPAGGLPVSSHLCNVVLDFHSMLKVVHGNSLHETERVLENGGPVLNGMDIFVHSSASLKGEGQLEDDVAEI